MWSRRFSRPTCHGPAKPDTTYFAGLKIGATRTPSASSARLWIVVRFARLGRTIVRTHGYVRISNSLAIAT